MLMISLFFLMDGMTKCRQNRDQFLKIIDHILDAPVVSSVHVKKKEGIEMNKLDWTGFNTNIFILVDRQSNNKQI